MIKEVRRREFIKSAFLGANCLFLPNRKLDFLARAQLLQATGKAYQPLSRLIYQNDFSTNLDGITSYAALNLRLENGQMKFSSTNAGRGVHVGPAYPRDGKQYTLIIKLNSAGRSGLKVLQNRADSGSIVQTITTNNEVSIPFTADSNSAENRIFLSTSGPEYDISVDYIRIYEIETGQSATDLWAGTYQQTVNNRLYTWIPSREATIIPQSNGSVVLKAPQSRSSFLNGNHCNRFVYDENYRQLGSGFLNDLFGSGVNLPDGQYHYLIHYFNVNDYESVDADPWRLAGNPDTYLLYSSPPEAISFSVETIGAGSQGNKVMTPATQERVSWVITNQFLPENLSLPSEKVFGITRMHWDVNPGDKVGNINEVLKKATQIQTAGRYEFDTINPDKLWDCVTGTGLTAQQIADSIRLSPGRSVMGQMKEQGVSNIELERAFQLMYRRLQSSHGVSNANQTMLFEDYFASTDGFGNGAKFSKDNSYEERKRQLSSSVEARRLYTHDYNNGVKPTSEYFLQYAYDYRNRGVSGYMDSYQRIPQGIMAYRLIFEFEKAYIAINDRKTKCMSWAESEGVSSQTTRFGVQYRLKLPGGDLLRSQSVGFPFELMKTQSFFSLLLGNVYALWNDSTNLVRDISNWEASSKGGSVDFHVNGTPYPVRWDINNSNHPKPVQSNILVNNRKTTFPSAPQIGEQGAWVGAYLYSQISKVSDRVSQSIQYASFSYRINDGGTQSGYQNGNDPLHGSRGNAEISRAGVVNEGQHNIVDQWEYKKPIVILTRGGNGFSVLIKNVFCEPTDKVVYIVNVNGSTREIIHTGRSLGIFLF